MTTPLVREAKALIRENDHGILSTFSMTEPGYPFGSLVAYCLDQDGCLIVLLSALAEHTKNIAQNPKVSLIIVDIKESDLQNSKRVTLLADAAKADTKDPSLKERYYTRFPQARAYGEMLDFSLYRLKPIKLRYVGGFGKASSIEPADYIS